MFTGIIEEIGIIGEVITAGTNRDLWIEAPMSSSLKIDQSVAHNGVCLTVVEVRGGSHRVTAVHETLQRSQLGDLKSGVAVNLERCLRIGNRLDGHMVQGHVDTTTICTDIKDVNGSWTFTFRSPREAHLLVPKGSICINGVSLTIAELWDDRFSVAIIPYTFDHTTFNTLRVGDRVNVEFDILGKYVDRILQLRSIRA